jgi:hypothetical protein
MYVCMYVCMYVYMYVCMYIYTQVRHLLQGADWSDPKCSARAAKTLEQIISLVESFPVCVCACVSM